MIQAQPPWAGLWAPVLSDVHGLSHDQVAAALGINIGTVRSRLHGARNRLRTALAHRAPNQAAPAYADARTA